MSRYQVELSQKAIESKERRIAVVAFQKKVILVLALALVSLLIIFGSTMITFAGSGEQTEPIKDYVSIQVQSGDTLWDIASKYTKGYGIDIDDYIEDVMSVNGLTNEQIHCGSYLIIPEYHFDSI